MLAIYCSSVLTKLPKGFFRPTQCHPFKRNNDGSSRTNSTTLLHHLLTTLLFQVSGITPPLTPPLTSSQVNPYRPLDIYSPQVQSTYVAVLPKVHQPLSPVTQTGTLTLTSPMPLPRYSNPKLSLNPVPRYSNPPSYSNPISHSPGTLTLTSPTPASRVLQP